ncbi:MAG: hypothetical protein QT00_C0003G0022 [archaeon GW2011_AR5]|nr:MAG: hypothetical protein QT00_C0003G0022 [archaeon GW2011_AR5]
MQHETKHIFTKAKDISLSKEEKELLRARIDRFVAGHPPKLGASIAGASPRQWFTPWEMLSVVAAHARMPIAIALILVISGGTALAAQGALPGDPLYAVKNLTETIESKVAVGAKASAGVEAKHALARLSEAETLAAQGKLDEKRTAQVKERLGADLAAMNESVVALEAKGDAEGAARVSGRFAEGLGEHFDAFLTLSDEVADTISDAKPLIREVASSLRLRGKHTRAQATEEVQTLSLMAPSSLQETAHDASKRGERTGAEVSASAEMEIALRKITDVRAFLDGQAVSASTEEILDKAYERLREAEGGVSEGQEMLSQGDYVGAYVFFKEAEFAALEARLIYTLSTAAQKHGRGSSEVEAKLKIETEIEVEEEETSGRGASLEEGADSDGGSVSDDGTPENGKGSLPALPDINVRL